MLVIRLSLSGSKKRPFYHLTVTDSRKPRDGSNKEKIGFFNPMARGQDVTFSIKADRLKYWLDVGKHRKPKELFRNGAWGGSFVRLQRPLLEETRGFAGLYGIQVFPPPGFGLRILVPGMSFAFPGQVGEFDSGRASAVDAVNHPIFVVKCVGRVS